jgi:hypothetical protein
MLIAGEGFKLNFFASMMSKANEMLHLEDAQHRLIPEITDEVKLYLSMRGVKLEYLDNYEEPSYVSDINFMRGRMLDYLLTVEKSLFNLLGE